MRGIPSAQGQLRFQAADTPGTVGGSPEVVTFSVPITAAAVSYAFSYTFAVPNSENTVVDVSGSITVSDGSFSGDSARTAIAADINTEVASALGANNIWTVTADKRCRHYCLHSKCQY